MDIIEREFRHKAILRGGIFMFNPSDVLDVIKRCYELNIRIKGIDAFVLTESNTRPVPEQSMDYSYTQEGNWSDAENFIIERLNSGLVFDIVYD
jgi:hypothetical protein